MLCHIDVESDEIRDNVIREFLKERRKNRFLFIGILKRNVALRSDIHVYIRRYDIAEIDIRYYDRSEIGEIVCELI